MNETSHRDMNEVRVQNSGGFKDIKPQKELSKKELSDGVRKEFDNAKNEFNKPSIKEESSENAKPREFKDDNGLSYREGDNLLPNKEFEINGYRYKTDSQGRVISAEGKLQVKDHEGRSEMDPRSAVDKGDMKTTDDRGHLIADRFNGSGGIENLSPMKGELNKGDFARLENKLADAVGAGADVRLKVEPKYDGDSSRPTEYKVTYSINGERDMTVFKN